MSGAEPATSKPKYAKPLWLAQVGSTRAPVELPRAGVLTLGADANQADLAVEGADVAPVHCAIGRIKGAEGWALKDLGSSAGTRVNGHSVRSVPLKAGDAIQLGAARLVILDSPSQAPLQPPSPSPAPAPAPAPSKDNAARATGDLAVTQNLPALKGYTILKPLGRGGMGSVFLAKQESLNRKIALKILADHLTKDSDFVRRFQAEARAAAQLNHPNVVTVFDVWSEGGRHLLSMEFMERGNLENRVAKNGPLPWREVLQVVLDAAKGLEYAEVRGIVHRDIKPANLMQDEIGITKIADLGLATQIEAEATESENKKIFGTPHFISPEQARGEKVDSRSDLYSLGCTAYRLLSAHTPFEGATTREILRGHLKDQPRPLAQRVLGLPPDVAALVERLMQKDPAQRFQSAAALRTQIERLQAGGGPAPKRPLLLPVLLGMAALALGFWLWKTGWLSPGAPINVGDVGDVRNPPGIRAAGGSRPADPGAAPADPQGTQTPADSDPAQPANPVVQTPMDAEPALANGGLVDDDSTLRALEQEAEQAHAKLSSLLTKEERRQALASLVERYRSTNRARGFEQEIAALEREIAAAAAPQAGLPSQLPVDPNLERWRALGQDERAPSTAGRPSVRELLAQVESEATALLQDADAATSAAVSSAKHSAQLEIAQGACERASKLLQDLERMFATGEFDAAEKLLDQQLSKLAPGDAPAELPQPVADVLASCDRVAKDLEEKRGSLPERRERFLLERSRQGAQRAALAMSGPRGVEDCLARLDWTGLGACVNQIDVGGLPPHTLALLEELRQHTLHGPKALALLTAEYQAGNWRRRTLTDPRERSTAMREAVAVSLEGLTLRTDTGTEALPWSAFGSSPRDLHNLFKGRLQREWTLEERSGVAHLLWTSSISRLVADTRARVGENRRGKLDEAKRAELLEGFALAREWADGAQLERIRVEESASALWLDAVTALTGEQWALAAAHLEALLGDHARSLLVHLLSNGNQIDLGRSKAPTQAR